MSRIGRQPVNIPSNVQVTINGQDISVKGDKGELNHNIHHKIKISYENDQILVERKKEDKLSKSLHGLTKKLIDNMVEGVSKGFERKLDIIGVGYRAQLTGEKVVINIGYSHPVEVIPPTGISFKVEKNSIIVSGIDKQLVGQVAANIRKIRKPEPYKGKGIRYSDEIVKTKPGKAAKTGA
jgi:large subunit ribosomal protein L6